MVLALADDLTGALEVGAKFAGAGIASLVTTRLAVVPGDVLVIDTETRHLPAAEAWRRVFHIASSARASLVYKKTDSTLRGNIGAELEAVTVANPGALLHYAPAYP